MKAPIQIKKHNRKFHRRAWEQYSIEELGQWVHLFAKRSHHRTDMNKRDKDLADARNYWRMIGAHLDELEEKAK